MTEKEQDQVRPPVRVLLRLCDSYVLSYGYVAASKPEKDSDAIIDLTGDEELSQALQASLNEPNPNFGPSNRAPDPQWAMVSSNVINQFLPCPLSLFSLTLGRKLLSHRHMTTQMTNSNELLKQVLWIPI